ncbi:MAG TPA: acyl-CoA dehydrogenase family protein [Solirubrobacteraceae bacterium]|nr:acyl-CoA dehydrogenase family protein [Solirubrobacteraceae bacterium]
MSNVAQEAAARDASREAAARLIEGVADAADLIEGGATQAELDGTLTPEVVARMREIGLFWLKTPHELGGFELDPLDFCDVLEQVAYHDASAGWAMMVGNGVTGLMAGLLPDEGIRRVFSDESRPPIMCGQFAPRGRAVPVDGGYRVTGRWGFCSGSPHADWVIGGAVPEGGGPADALWVCVPIGEATIHDNWHVAGLQGTGSNDVSVEDVLVPAELAVRAVGEPPKRGGPLYEQPPMVFVGNELGPVAVGIARRAVDDMIALASGTARKAAGSRLSDRVAFHKALGRAEARIASARALQREAVVLGRDSTRAGLLDDGVVATVMARVTLTLETCLETVAELFRYGGGRVLALDHPLQRHYRNALAAAQHVYVTEENFEAAGRALLDRAGVAPAA